MPPIGSEAPFAARFAASVTAGHASNVIYVNDDATGANNGTSWEDAFNDLQDGLLAAAESLGPDEIWVAEGVYRPTAFGDRSASFNLPNEVSVLGGFAASLEEPSLRDAEQYPTVLSGDIGVPGATFDNSYNVVSVNGGTAALSGVTVEGGNANNNFFFSFRSGGGIRTALGASLAVSDVVIANNSAIFGGGIYSFSSTVTIVDSSVTDNFAQSRGGGVYGTNAILDFIDTEIVANSAANEGGGIFAIGGSQISISESSIANNSSRRGGGAWFQNSVVDVHASSFSDNIASSQGGGIYSFSSTVTIVDSSVTDNFAQSSGGGVFGAISQLEFIDTDIVSNSAGSTGGGMLASGGSLIFDGGQVVGNSAGSNGGGIYPANATTTITDAVFRENSSGLVGGGLQVRGGSATVEGSQFYGNTATLRGGGINVDRPNTSVTISDVIVENNTARSGGGIANTESSMSLSNSVVSNNAAKFGGGIIHQFSTLTMTNVAVTNNTAEENAGGLFNFRGQAYIDSSEFDGNKALGLNTENFPFVVGRGGAIENVGLSLGSFIEIRNSVFHRNFAANQGGAIDNNGISSQLVITDSRVSQNKTGGNGGGLFNEGSTLIERVHFAHNIAQQFGGAIFIASGQVDVKHSRLTGNKAGLDLGSAVYVGLGGDLLVDELTVVSKNGIPIYFES